jgi:hypothetical protein
MRSSKGPGVIRALFVYADYKGLIAGQNTNLNPFPA